MGTKLEKINMSGTTTTPHYYAGMFEYDNARVLTLIHTEEGMVNVSHTGGTVYTNEYHIKDHPENVRVAFSPGSTYPNQVNDYYPFGLISCTQNSGTNKFLYNGKELQEYNIGDTKLEWYDYGARFYDPQIARWHSVDPKVQDFYSLSPYNYCYNNPLNVIDLDGRSGEAVLDEKNKTITVNVHMVYYGNAASEDIAKSTSAEIQTMWYDAKGTVKIGDVEYTVSFNVTSEVVSEDKAVEMAGDNKSAATNFVRIEEKNGNVDRSFYQLGGNTGYFVTSDNLGKSTTTAHEEGHGFGLGHSASDQRGQGTPDIMAARGTYVDPQYQYNKNAQAGQPGGTVNPIYRTVQQKNITEMFKNVQFKRGRANIGTATNTIYNANGTRKN